MVLNLILFPPHSHVGANDLQELVPTKNTSGSNKQYDLYYPNVFQAEKAAYQTVKIQVYAIKINMVKNKTLGKHLE